MADIFAIFFILLIISIAFPSMLTAWWLLFPSVVARAQTRVEKTLSRTFWLGLVIIIVLAAFFPVIGRLFLWPVLLITAFGATGFVLLNWMPRGKTPIPSTMTSPSHT